MEMSALDIGYVVSKLKEIEGGKLDKIYQTGKKEFIFAFHKGGKKLVKVILGKGIFLIKTKEDVDKASVLSMFLRKRLKQSRLRKVIQKDFERIVVFEFDTYTVILELFSKGNLVLVDKKGSIEIVSERQSWSGRELKKGVKYEFPPERFNLYKAKDKELKEMLSDIKRESLVKALAVDFGLGGRHAELVCAKAKVDKKAKEFDVDKVLEVIKQVRDFKFFNKNFEFDISKEFREKSVYEKEIEKVQEVIKGQEEHLEELKKEIGEYKLVGDKIYSNFNLIEDLIKKVLDSKWKFKDKRIKELKPSEGKIVLEV